MTVAAVTDFVNIAYAAHKYAAFSASLDLAQTCPTDTYVSYLCDTLDTHKIANSDVAGLRHRL
jgi:hypothetical protein